MPSDMSLYTVLRNRDKQVLGKGGSASLTKLAVGDNDSKYEVDSNEGRYLVVFVFI